MCQPAAPIDMNPRSMLCQSVSRVPPPPSGSSSQRMSCPPPAEFEQLGRVGPLHLGLGYLRRRRPHGRELCGANGAEVPVRIERSRERLPNLGRRVGEVADENERPLLSLFSDLSARSGTRRVWLTAAHVFSFLSSVAPGHRRALTRSAGRERAMRRAPSAAPVSVDRGAAALQFVIPRTQPLAALAGAWRRTAATVEARARSRQRSAQTRAAGSRWPVCWAANQVSPPSGLPVASQRVERAEQSCAAQPCHAFRSQSIEAIFNLGTLGRN